MLPSQQARRHRGGELWRQIRRGRWGYLFISPFYISFLTFGLFPILFSVYLSFHSWKGLGPMQFVGLKNYLFLAGVGGKQFWQSILNGVLLFLIYVPIMTFLAIVLAVLLNSKRTRFFQAYRTAIFAPYVTSMVAAGFTFKLLLAKNGGLFNIALGSFGVSGVPWLEDIWWARISLSLLIMWGWLGYNMVLMLAGLQTIPRELNEAALIDGATPTQALFHVTIPLLRPVILFSVLLSTMGSFGLFNEVMALTGGGPMRATLTPLVYLYGIGFRDFQFGSRFSDGLRLLRLDLRTNLFPIQIRSSRRCLIRRIQ